MTSTSVIASNVASGQSPSMFRCTTVTQLLQSIRSTKPCALDTDFLRPTRVILIGLKLDGTYLPETFCESQR